MGDRTKGFKVTDDLYEKLTTMIELSGLNDKEWFEKAVSLVELNELKEGSTEYREDLTELEGHTTRIYELVANMIYRANFLKEQAVKTVQDKLNQTEGVIGEYQQKVNEVREEFKTVKELLSSSEEQREGLVVKVTDLEKTKENSLALIDEYKAKNDTLTGLVSKYQPLANENELLQKEFEEEKEKILHEKREIMAENVSFQEQIEKLENHIDSLKEKSASDLQALTDKKEFEKERELLAKERQHQTDIAKLNEDFNKQLRSQYDEIFTNMRKEYEQKIDRIETQLEEQRKHNDDLRREYEQKIEKLQNLLSEKNDKNNSKK